ncbi:uncharacterized protein [Medicago truncatula]|uniref:uncharacterized protein n=1 Tax=Medicago truncatula TaxID=3880 RepID=UPI0019686548|nr:uncharacterized protein LOC120577056 [Medicago truncatula]
MLEELQENWEEDSSPKKAKRTITSETIVMPSFEASEELKQYAREYSASKIAERKRMKELSISSFFVLMAAKVIPEQVAFLVDKYLLDHNFSSTRYTFRNEASRLFAHSPIQEAPKNLMTLDEILYEYISLKNHKVTMDQEMFIIEQEKNRNMMLLQGMHNVTAAYIAGGNCPPPAAKSSPEFVLQTRINNKSYPGELRELFDVLINKKTSCEYLNDHHFTQLLTTFSFNYLQHA